MPAKTLKLDRGEFLAQYWQKKPLLVRSAIEGFEPPLDANTLAGLAMEDEIESRIVEFRDDKWQLSHGPFSENDFNRKHPWTLLVQAVDHYLPEVAQLRKLVDFIPQWRIDDIMISYAENGGSVGPHYDNYDVFLLQGEGQRTWQLGQSCDENTGLLPHDELRILSEFNAVEEHTLACGDMLYVPPGVAHWGVAQGNCMTYSIGFRAPRLNELLSRNVDSVLEHCQADLFYRDSELSASLSPGEISPDAIQSARLQLQNLLDGAARDSWFGELVTEPKYDYESDTECWEDLYAGLQSGVASLILPSSCKLAWQRKQTGVYVFANGESLHSSTAVIPMLQFLCEHWQLQAGELASALKSPHCTALLKQLLELGCLESRSLDSL